MPKIRAEGSAQAEPEVYRIGTSGDTHGASGLEVQYEPTPDNPILDIRTGNAEYDEALRAACLAWLAQRNAE